MSKKICQGCKINYIQTRSKFCKNCAARLRITGKLQRLEVLPDGTGVIIIYDPKSDSWRFSDHYKDMREAENLEQDLNEQHKIFVPDGRGGWRKNLEEI